MIFSRLSTLKKEGERDSEGERDREREREREIEIERVSAQSMVASVVIHCGNTYNYRIIQYGFTSLDICKQS